MGLRAVAAQALATAFRAAGDAVTEVKYRAKTQGAYVAATDTQGETEADTDIEILYDFKKKANEWGDVNVGGGFTGAIEGIISAVDLPPNTPKTEDLIVDGTSIYKIKGITPIGPFSEAVGYTLSLEKDSA